MFAFVMFFFHFARRPRSILQRCAFFFVAIFRDKKSVACWSRVRLQIDRGVRRCDISVCRNYNFWAFTRIPPFSVLKKKIHSEEHFSKAPRLSNEYFSFMETQGRTTQVFVQFKMIPSCKRPLSHHSSTGLGLDKSCFSTSQFFSALSSNLTYIKHEFV